MTKPAGYGVDAARGVVWSSVEKWISKAVSTAVFIALARLLQPEHFGLVALAAVFVTLATILADQGLSQAIIQRQVLERRHINAAFWLTQGVGVVLLLAVQASAGLMATAFDEPLLAPVLRWLSAGFVLSGLGSTAHALLRRELRFRAIAVRQIAGTLAGGAAALVVADFGGGVWALVVLHLVSAAVSTVVLWASVSWRPTLQFEVGGVRELYGYGVAALGTDLLGFASRSVDSVLIGALLGVEALGYYTIAYRMLLVLLELFGSSLGAVMLPVVSRLQHDLTRVRTLFLLALRTTALLVIPTFGLMGALSNELIVVFFGAAWADSVVLMRMLALAGMIQAVFFLNGQVINAVGRPYVTLGLASVQVVSMTAVLLVTLPHGIVIAVAAYVLRGYMFSPLAFMAVRHTIGILPKDYLRQLTVPVFATAGSVLAALGIRAVAADAFAPWVLLFAAGTTGVMVYVGIVCLIARAQVKEVVGLFMRSLPGVADQRPPSEPV